ncbi:MAG: FixH family protein [Gammaproteobacteria bacterium]|nr:FixH family protein [Gammaproteobacteria bacterium]
MEREDTKPWYRQFWPWFIIALPASAVVAGLTTVWIAMQTTDSLVVASGDGVRNATDRHLLAERLATELGVAALVEIDPETGVVSAAVQSRDLDALPATLEFELSHPAFANRDQHITLSRAMDDGDGNSIWVGHFVSMPSGRFYAVLKAGDDWRVSAEWQGETSLMLRAGGTGDDDGR